MMGNTERNMRAVRIGQVVSSKMDQTVVIKVSRRFPHPLYKRIITRTAKLVAHDAENECREGDVVKVMDQCRLAGAANVSLAARRPDGDA